MKIGTITFHGAHNYGSVLQAYALQTFTEKLFEESNKECKYEIINFRSDFQKELYGVKKSHSLKKNIKKFLELPYSKSLKIKKEKFEYFINNILNVSEEINNEENLKLLSDRYDVCISGSDQIWNIRAKDFSFAYLLNWTKAKKVSYAASLGPLNIDWNLYDKKKYTEYLKNYFYFSVREEKSKTAIDSLLNNNTSFIHIDPTLLIDKCDWQKIESDLNYNNGKYIFFYCLEPNKKHLEFAKRICKKFSLPIVISGWRNKKDYINPFVKLYSAGPLDFLSLIDHASLIITSSFHGTAFSVNYNKPFYVIDGLNDNRIRTILKETQTENRSVSDFARIDNMTLSEPDKKSITCFLEKERKRSKEYLKQIFEL